VECRELSDAMGVICIVVSAMGFVIEL